MAKANGKALPMATPASDLMLQDRRYPAALWCRALRGLHARRYLGLLPRDWRAGPDQCHISPI